MSKVRGIAYVLPQYHPIPENDSWWGKGFTEWTNVTKALPLFEGHYQPHLPTDLGFYDLRLPEARQAQADLAQEHGIYGFCYYHYWFNGKRLLHKPIDGMLAQKGLNMPFMFCWANENWTRRWDGKDEDVLMKQDYSLEDDKAHMRWLCKHVFSDERYIKVAGKPVFQIYRHDLFPDIQATLAVFREVATKEFGYPDIYACLVQSFNNLVDPVGIGFDAAVEFSPHIVGRVRLQPKTTILEKIKFKKSRYDKIDLRDYHKSVDLAKSRKKEPYKLYRSVTPSWDNTPRKGKSGFVVMGATPKCYGEWLKHTIEHFEPYSEQENFLFINAMNEWAEGNHLEPCRKFGLQFLEETKKILTATYI